MYRSHAGASGPGKPNSMPSTEGGFSPTTSMAGSGEKLGMDPWIGQPSCCEICQAPFFSGAVALSITADDSAQGCHMWTT
jgi:hypothetical protein